MYAPAEMSAEIPILYSCAPEAGRRLAGQLASLQPLFVCVIASTETALVPGVSAAGASADLIPYTAAADAEVLAHGSARCIAGMPCSPMGPPGPAIITAAALELAGIPHTIVNAGCGITPDAPYVDLGGSPGRLISDGQAVDDADGLFERGRELGRQLASEHEYLVIGESVPGGTTTALALLLALGVAADGRVSSSMSGNPHSLKSRLAREALARLDRSAAARNPLVAVATLGDPMQPVVAGLAAGAADVGRPVLLAGGTQMMAVLALMHAMATLGLGPVPGDTVALATTRWIVEDPTADAIGLMGEVGAQSLMATPLSFAESRHPGLRLYEQNLVKEGVGAGGATVAAALAAGIAWEEVAVRAEAFAERLAAAMSP